MDEKELVPYGGDKVCTPNGVVQWRPKVGTPLTECPTSLDLATQRGRALALAAGNPGDVEFDKSGIADITATDWLLYPDEGENPETGEVGVFIRLVLFDASGKTFRTTASHGPSRLKAALDLFDRADWVEGIPFRITRRLGKRDRWYHDIRLHPDYLQEE